MVHPTAPMCRAKAHLGHFLHHCDQMSGLLSQTHGTSGGAQVSNWRVASAKCEGGGAQFSWCTGWAVNFAPLAGHSWAVVTKYPNGCHPGPWNHHRPGHRGLAQAALGGGTSRPRAPKSWPQHQWAWASQPGHPARPHPGPAPPGVVIVPDSRKITVLKIVEN